MSMTKEQMGMLRTYDNILNITENRNIESRFREIRRSLDNQ